LGCACIGYCPCILGLWRLDSLPTIDKNSCPRLNANSHLMRLVYPIVKTYVMHNGLSHPADYMILHLKRFSKTGIYWSISGSNVVLCGEV